MAEARPIAKQPPTKTPKRHKNREVEVKVDRKLSHPSLQISYNLKCTPKLFRVMIHNRDLSVYRDR